MAHLSSVGGVSAGRLEPVVRPVNMDSLRIPRSSHRGEDVAEISASAFEAARGEGTPIRAELVRQVRQQIAAGTYLTSDKLEATAERIVRDLDLTA